MVSHRLVRGHRSEPRRARSGVAADAPVIGAVLVGAAILVVSERFRTRSPYETSDATGAAVTTERYEVVDRL
jgi:hypothetical protein